MTPYVNPEPFDHRVKWPDDLDEAGQALPGDSADARARCRHAMDVFAAAILADGRRLTLAVFERPPDHPYVRVAHPGGVSKGEYQVYPYPDVVRVDWRPYTMPPVVLVEVMTPSAALSVVLDHVCGMQPYVPGPASAGDR
jgi:hypothetical protein